MERRVLVAVFLSFLVLFVYQLFVVRQAPPPPSEPAATPQASPPAESQGRPAAGPAPEQPSPEHLPAVEPLVADASARDVVVETRYVRAVFDTRGAVLKSYQLKEYEDAAGAPLELVPVALSNEVPRPFTLRTPDALVTARLAQALFQPSADRLDLTARAGELAFEYHDAAGLAASKVFRFDPDASPYVIAVEARVAAGDKPLNTVMEWGPGFGPDLTEADGGTWRQRPQGIFFRGGDVTRLPESDVQAQAVYEGQFGFVGIDDQYFLSAALEPQANVRVEYRPVPLPGPAEGETRTLIAYSLDVEGLPLAARVFFGPKDFDVLAANGRDLVRAINFGIFAVIVVPLLRALKWINGYVGNYGWSIIILTILINAAMFPLRHKSVVSMRKLQALQPEIKAIQDRYAKLKLTDPARQKMNTEVMNLYRERGVNPASGCLPMLLTMPVLFAFYSLLSVAIEIRGAPFILWIRDLSTHDPLYITPLLMGASMVWQQKLTPSTGDPTQQKVMMIMPVVFTFMFLWFPSGLVLYWLTSNLWGIGQQVITNRVIGPPRVRAARPPAERRLKRRSGGAEATKEA